MSYWSKHTVPFLKEEVHHKNYSPTVVVSLIGGFQISSGGQPVSLTPGVQRLIALLALESRPVPRPYVAGRLWPDVTENRALGNLRSTLWRLRQDSLNMVNSNRGQLQLDPATSIDVPEMVAVARRLLRPESNCSDDDLDVTRFKGELLADWSDDWLILERERLRQLCLYAIEAIASRLTQASRYAEAVDAALIAIASEPFRESAYRTLIQAHLAGGNKGEAVRQYTKYRNFLAQELGAAPSVELQEWAVTLLK